MARLSQRLYQQVAARARDRCEYCGLAQEAEVMDLTVDHVVPRAGQGSTELSNLALACLACNARKWKFTEGSDPQTGRSVRSSIHGDSAGMTISDGSKTIRHGSKAKRPRAERPSNCCK